jgi:energy-coupling factor transport system ATP-binding protein
MADFKIENLSFEYPATGKKALDNVNLSIKQGEYIVVCGKSGSGKTTLLRHLKSVLTPHGNVSGKILLDGRPLKEVSLREQSSKIGYVMQNPDNQIVKDKVWHELAFGLESLGCDKRTMRLRVAEMASYFGIQSWFHSDVSSLSGGQKQLLNLASIMAMQPTVIILDEPTSQLDPIAAMDFLSTVRKINLELGTTIIISEHR